MSDVASHAHREPVRLCGPQWERKAAISRACSVRRLSDDPCVAVSEVEHAGGMFDGAYSYWGATGRSDDRIATRSYTRNAVGGRATTAALISMIAPVLSPACDK